MTFYRSLTFRNVHIRCGECGVLMKWRKCGEVMKELLKGFKYLEEFHFYDRIQRREDVTAIAEALTLVPNITKVTLTDVNEEACEHLSKIGTLQELQILVYKYIPRSELERMRAKFDEHRESYFPYCSLVIRDIFEVPG